MGAQDDWTPTTSGTVSTAFGSGPSCVISMTGREPPYPWPMHRPRQSSPAKRRQARAPPNEVAPADPLGKVDRWEQARMREGERDPARAFAMHVGGKDLLCVKRVWRFVGCPRRIVGGRSWASPMPAPFPSLPKIQLRSPSLPPPSPHFSPPALYAPWPSSSSPSPPSLPQPFCPAINASCNCFRCDLMSRPVTGTYCICYHDGCKVEPCAQLLPQRPSQPSPSPYFPPPALFSPSPPPPWPSPPATPEQHCPPPPPVPHPHGNPTSTSTSGPIPSSAPRSSPQYPPSRPHPNLKRNASSSADGRGPDDTGPAQQVAGHRGPTIRVIVPLVSVAIIVVILGLLYTCSRKSVKISHRARPSLRLTTRKSTRTLRPRLHLNMQMTEMVVAPPLAENPDSADVEYIARRRHSARLLGRWAVGSPH